MTKEEEIQKLKKLKKLITKHNFTDYKEIEAKENNKSSKKAISK